MSENGAHPAGERAGNEGPVSGESGADTRELVRVFDTTLRDGEQSPGASMTSEEKLEVARALSRLGVDIIEAGFPAASPDDLAAVRMIAERVGADSIRGRPQSMPVVVTGLARAVKVDIDKAWEGVRAARHPRIHTFLSTSPIHRKHKLRATKEEVVERVRSMVGYARSLCEDIEFSCEDASRTELDFLAEVVSVAVAEGATTINLPDTVGYATPDEIQAMLRAVREGVPGMEKVILSVHCHDDLGMATANTLAGLSAGARQCEVTINGIGERAGNASLEEVVMAIATRADKLGLRTNIDSTELCRTSRLVSSRTGMVVAPNKAIVGANAFAHESGIHQDGLLKHGATYEIMRAESVGAAGTQLVLGKHSGRAALSARLAELGCPVEGEVLDQTFTRFKAIAERRKQVTDADILALVSSERREEEGGYRLEALQVAAGTQGMPTATVRLRDPSGELHTQAAVGTGPVHAAFQAIDAIVGGNASLLEYSVHAVTEGIDALGEVTVRVRGGDGAVCFGYGADTDVLVASAKSYLAALNRCRELRPAAVASTDAPYAVK